MQTINNGRFTSESLKGNQFAKGNPPNKTSFTNEHTMQNHPCWKGGMQKHKDGYYIQLSTNKRMKHSRYIYEMVYGEIPPHHVVYHLDGDIYNDQPSNLQAITRAELVKLNNNRII
jgi:HNH endonuclease